MLAELAGWARTGTPWPLRTPRAGDGLRVCDASLFPTIPAANINVPAINMPYEELEERLF
ncbi:GMC oxidoreductase [Labrys sp. La1]